MKAAALDISSILQSALSLPLPERSYLAERLIVSLDSDDGELTKTERAEFDKRVQRRQGGETPVHSREEVKAHIQKLLA
jgi:putative addiction module component (TIGR02574 family)